MWIANLAVLFGIKSLEKTRDFKFSIMAFMIFLPELLMGLFVLFGFERYSLNSANVMVSYSHSLFTVSFIFVVGGMIFDYLNFDPKETLTYALLPLVNIGLNAIAFPKSFLHWHPNSSFEGVFFYNTLGSPFLALSIEVVITLLMYFLYRKQNDLNALGVEKRGAKKPIWRDPAESHDKQNKRSNETNPEVYSPVDGWTKIEKKANKKNKPSILSKKIEWNNADALIILGLLAGAIPIYFQLFF